MINETMTKEIEEIKDALGVIKLWLDDEDYNAIAEKVNTEYAQFRLNQARHQLNKALAGIVNIRHGLDYIQLKP
jgi:hypothetical protein